MSKRKKKKTSQRGGAVEDGIASAPIAGCPKYRVTEDGRAYNIKSGLYLVPDLHASGYYRCKLMREDGKRVGMAVHRLVAMGFVANPLNLPEVHHIDHDKSNNRRDNLMWVTSSQNNLFTRDAGKHSLHVLTMAQATEMRINYAEGEPQRSIAARYGVCQVNVSRVVRNTIWHDPSYAPPNRACAVSDTDAMEIRLLIAQGAKASSLAKQYRISYSYVRHIVNGTRKRKKTATGE